MLPDGERTNIERYERVAYWLEREAYRQQMEGRTKPLKHFYPCAKALVFTAAMAKRPVPVTSVVVQDAYYTECACHHNLTETELLNHLFADTGEKPNER